MEKVCRKSAVKTSSIPYFNIGKYPKIANACRRLLEINYFKRGHEKVNLIFSFAPSPFLWTRLCKTKNVWNYLPVFELQNMFTKIHILVWPFESENWKKKRKKTKH